MEWRITNRRKQTLILKRKHSRMHQETTNLMEAIVSRENMLESMQRVRANKGAAGIDGISVYEAPRHLQERWPTIRQQLLSDSYEPQGVRRVEIPKPKGGTRTLGIPTVTDRLIQQAILQVLTPIFDPTFSPYSFGFRPNKNAHQAIEQARQYVEDGYTFVVDLDLAKFFDNVNHDRLMARLAVTIKDKRLLKLIRRYLQSGGTVGEDKDVRGTPQGGPLSPLLANIVLDEFDRELERRGHCFVRYADDCSIFVKSQRAGERVLLSVERWLDTQLRLPVNRDKSAVGRYSTRTLLGFTLWSRQDIRIAMSWDSKRKLKERIRDLTPRKNTRRTAKDTIQQLNVFLRGWLGYYRLGASDSFLGEMDGYARRRLRMHQWKAWKNVRTRRRNLEALGMETEEAQKNANTRKGYWHVSNSQILATTLTNRYFQELGLFSLQQRCRELRLQR